MPDSTRDEAWVTVVTLERDAGQRLFGYALHLGVDPARAADLVQETLLRLWRELGNGTRIATPEAWAYRTMSRLAMDEHRFHRRAAALARRLAERPAPRVTEIDATERVAVWAQVERLPVRQRQAVYLRYHADLSFAEVALVMGITEAGARSLASQALATLRASFRTEETG